MSLTAASKADPSPPYMQGETDYISVCQSAIGLKVPHAAVR